MNFVPTKHHWHPTRNPAIDGANEEWTDTRSLENANNLLSEYVRVCDSECRSFAVEIAFNAPHALIDYRRRRSLLGEFKNALIKVLLFIVGDSLQGELHECVERNRPD